MDCLLSSLQISHAPEQLQLAARNTTFGNRLNWAEFVFVQCESQDTNLWRSRATGGHKKFVDFFFFVVLLLCQNVDCVPDWELIYPPVCPCSTKTSLTAPISTLGSFQSTFYPPNLSFHFPRHLLITVLFYLHVLLWLP